VSVPPDLSLADLRVLVTETGHTRYPVVETDTEGVDRARVATIHVREGTGEEGLTD
jgi:CBS domain-containing protein